MKKPLAIILALGTMVVSSIKSANKMSKRDLAIIRDYKLLYPETQLDDKSILYEALRLSGRQ